MQDSSEIRHSERQILNEAIKTFRVYCGTVLLSFAETGDGLRETVARNFVARGMSCTQNIFTVWEAASEQDAWILFRSLLDRLLHLHHLGKTDGFSDFDDFSFFSMYQARQQLLSDPDMKGKLPNSLKELQKANKAWYDLLAAKQSRWRRPKAEDVAKTMDLGFLYRVGYDPASRHTHPMSDDGEADFTRLIKPDGAVVLPDPTVVRNSILVQSMLVQEALNVSKLRWRALVYTFLDQIREFLSTGNPQFHATLRDVAVTWQTSKLCEMPSAGESTDAST
jgi:hypothetical protein